MNNNDDEVDEEISDISEIFEKKDFHKLIKIYNNQGNYSALQSINNVLFEVFNDYIYHFY